jgi:hypothetical protein
VIVVGVPEITPVEVLRLKPIGREGDAEYETTAPPVLLGVFGMMATPFVWTAGFAEYVRLVGAGVVGKDAPPPAPHPTWMPKRMETATA